MNIQTRLTASEIASSLRRQQAEMANEVHDEMAKNFWPMIGTSNQAAFVAVDDAVDALRESGMLRHAVKVKAMKALAEFERYDKSVVNHFRSYDDDRYNLWADLVTRAADRLQPDVDKMYYAIKSVLDRNGVKDSVVLAKVQTAMVMVSMSVIMFDTMAAEFQRKTMVINMQTAFGGGRLTAVQSNWREVSYLTGRSILQHVDLNDDATVKLSVDVIMNRYAQATFLNDAAGEALALNPDMEKYINDKTD